MPGFLTSTFSTSTNAKDFEVLYAGYRFEDVTTLFQVRHRVMNFVLGCWIQRDPIGYTGGLNLYTYVLNAPLSNVDSSGLFPQTLIPVCVASPPCAAALAAGALATALYFALWKSKVKSGTICRAIKWKLK